jgi:hypothetical protein
VDNQGIRVEAEEIGAYYYLRCILPVKSGCDIKLHEFSEGRHEELPDPQAGSSIRTDRFIFFIASTELSDGGRHPQV